MTIHAMSFGGGVQSTAMLVLAAQGNIPHRTAIFANVGDDSENPATLAYLRGHTIPYAEANGIAFVTIQKKNRDGDPITLLEKVTASKRSIDIPVRMANGAPGNRNCTETFKITPVMKELRRMGATKEDPADLALGISMDEFQRMRTSSGSPYYTLSYPLIELRMNRNDCLSLIKNAGLPQPPKSSCWFCPYFTLRQRDDQRRNEPELFAKTVSLERMLNERRAMLGKDDVFFTSKGKPLDEAVGDKGQTQLFVFDENDATCDIGGYCMS